ncbi:TVP38/TMEM64 family protein [Congregibacter variabilis]|uniref:TVP38/TMEM64 family membrane protein n=1 Tax=Congregibacter variabilis TaxID=3081200 RepID=A0ABZ0I4V7_9GAMM|nr:TVP38/TMEM64 family protein [Congregibacter sp. IMCC43200]
MEKHTHLTQAAVRGSTGAGQDRDLTAGPSPLWSVLAGIIILMLMLGLLLYFDAREQVLILLKWVDAQGLLGPVFFIVIMAAVVLLLLPGIFFTMGAGFVFGVTLGTICVVLGTTLGASLSFLVARYLLGPRSTSYLLAFPRLELIGAQLTQQRWKFVLLTRLIPFFPFKLSNYFFGLTRFSLGDFILGTGLGVIPFSLNSVYLGSIAADIATLGQRDSTRTPLEWTIYGCGFLAAMVALFYFNRLARSALARYASKSSGATG